MTRQTRQWENNGDNQYVPFSEGETWNDVLASLGLTSRDVYYFTSAEGDFPTNGCFLKFGKEWVLCMCYIHEAEVSWPAERSLCILWGTAVESNDPREAQLKWQVRAYSHRLEISKFDGPECTEFERAYKKEAVEFFARLN